MVNGLSALLCIGLQLLSVPICLKYWGRDEYGNWLTLYAAFMVVRSLDTGFVSYVGNKLNYLYHQDKHSLSEHLASSTRGVAIIAAIQLVIVLAAMYFESIARLLGISIESQHAMGSHSSLALLVLIGSWVLSGPYMGIVQRLLIPTGYMYQAAWWALGFQVTQFTGVIFAAALRFNIVQTSIIIAIIQFSVYAASAMYIRLKLPSFYPWWRGGHSRIGFKDLGHSMLLTASNCVQQGTTNGTVILLSILSGPAIVPVFTTVRTLTNLWTNVTSSLTTPLLPDIVRYHALGEARKVVHICEAYWVLVGSIVNIGVLITYPLIQPLYGYWTAHVVVLDSSLLSLLLACVVVANAGGLITLYLNGINNLRAHMTTSAGRGILSLVAGGYLFLYFGLAGFGIAILCGEVLALFVQTHFFYKSELFRNDVNLSFLSVLPIVVSTTSVLTFLISVGLGFALAQYLYTVALLSVTATFFWGWIKLDLEVRTRLVRLIRGLFARKSIV
jgi:O-antigen/teichoic acid export membrane protein